MSDVKRYIKSSIHTYESNLSQTEYNKDTLWVLNKDYEEKEAECKEALKANIELQKEIGRLTAINKTLLDACEKLEFRVRIDDISPIDVQKFARIIIPVEIYEEFESAIQQAKEANHD